MSEQEKNIPDHVAVIMDGNGRWAQKQGKPRKFGHEEGMEAIRRVTMRASERGVKVLTLYAFSTENWKRPPQEVHFLMQLPIRFFDRFVPELQEKNVKVNMIGFEEKVPHSTKKAISRAMDQTKDNTGMVLNFAFNYGGRAEIVEATQALCQKVLNKEISCSDISEERIEEHLFTRSIAPYQNVDLLIRSSGEQRLSNFLLWQNAYSEFYFTNLLWPDFDGEVFDQAILEYQKRQRRYGAI
ncbi:isoprenyl transferase [Alkalibacterium putridalgicola]|uniref:Isoprenyl transferase n=1 Tax=Alkalibacterium putridalgicola TaxID=426703 RepID=A0A1H7PVL5_9LACT|nr:isoprenyl transferase [Alkalibacterium putridalgicola]GEK88141.1 isoprenyl transferase [Alkalibacterium putridalgicola]SEL39444.1 undecaprenyl diphosphate synthase [Alkalibacterium putridalgicola]